MGTRLTNALLAALLMASIFGFALYQHEARKTQRMLGELIATLEQSRGQGPTLITPETASETRQADAGADPQTEGANRRKARDDDPEAAAAGDKNPADEPALVAAAGSRAGEASGEPGRSNVGGEEERSKTTGESADAGAATEAAGESGSASAGAGTEESDPASEPEDRVDDPDSAMRASDEDGSEAEGDRDSAAAADAWASHEPMVRAVLEELFAGEYEAVCARFTGDLEDVLTPARLEAFMEPIRQRSGGLERSVSHSRPGVTLQPGMEAFKVAVATESGPRLNFTITFDHRDENGPAIAGFLAR